MKPAILGLILAVGLHAAEEKTNEHKSFSGVRELVLDNISGFIEVTASTSGSVEMDIEKTLSGSSADRIALAKKEISLETTQEGGLVRVVVDGPFPLLLRELDRIFAARRLQVQLRFQGSRAARCEAGTADGEQLAHHGGRHSGRLHDFQRQWAD